MTRADLATGGLLVVAGVFTVALMVAAGMMPSQDRGDPEPRLKLKVENIELGVRSFDGTAFADITVSGVPQGRNLVTCALKDKSGKYLTSRSDPASGAVPFETVRFLLDKVELLRVVADAECYSQRW